MGWGGQYQFLTIIGLVFSILTFACGLLADLTLNRQLFELKNGLSVCSAPLEVLVSILYWGLCAIDKKLVVPPDLHLPFLPDMYVLLCRGKRNKTKLIVSTADSMPPRLS